MKINRNTSNPWENQSKCININANRTFVLSSWAQGGMPTAGDPFIWGLTAGAPRPAAPARSSGPRRRLRSARGRPRRKAGSAGRLRAHRHACSARTDVLAPRAPTRTLRALRRAYPARLPARRSARLPARNRHVLRRAPDASTDAYSARLEARSRHASAACEVSAF